MYTYRQPCTPFQMFRLYFDRIPIQPHIPAPPAPIQDPLSPIRVIARVLKLTLFVNLTIFSTAFLRFCVKHSFQSQPNPPPCTHPSETQVHFVRQLHTFQSNDMKQFSHLTKHSDPHDPPPIKKVSTLFVN